MREITIKEHEFEVGEVLKINGVVVEVCHDKCECDCNPCIYDDDYDVCDNINCDNIIFKAVKDESEIDADERAFKAGFQFACSGESLEDTADHAWKKYQEESKK